MTIRKVSAGQIWRPKASELNLVADVVNAFAGDTGGFRGTGDKLGRGTDTCFIRNSTGAALVRGAVVEVDVILPVETDPTTMLFDGIDPNPDGTLAIGIALQDVPVANVERFQLSGIVFARINIRHIQHTRADVDASEPLLQSHWHGRAEIIWKKTATTGEQWCLVRIGEMFRGPINAVITETGGIAYGGSGDVAIYWAGSAASPASTETAYLNWMTSTYNAAENSECQIWWHPDQQKYVIGNLEC